MRAECRAARGRVSTPQSGRLAGACRGSRKLRPAAARPADEGRRKLRLGCARECEWRQEVESGGARTGGALDRKLAPDEVGQLAVRLHAPRQRRHGVAQLAVGLRACRARGGVVQA